MSKASTIRCDQLTLSSLGDFSTQSYVVGGHREIISGYQEMITINRMKHYIYMIIQLNAMNLNTPQVCTCFSGHREQNSVDQLIQ